jgi:hypothetical protein
MQREMSIPSLASSSFIFLLLDPIFLLRSGNSQSCRNLVHVPHFGFTRSHFSFRFRHDTHDIVLSDGGGTFEVAEEEFVFVLDRGTESGDSISTEDAFES